MSAFLWIRIIWLCSAERNVMSNVCAGLTRTASQEAAGMSAKDPGKRAARACLPAYDKLQEAKDCSHV